MMTVVIWLLGLTTPLKTDVKNYPEIAQAAIDGSECFINRGVGHAPANLEPSLGLPPSANLPDGNVLIHSELAKDIIRRLHCLWLWPKAAQIALHKQAETYELRLTEERAATDTAIEIAEEPPLVEGFPAWFVVLLGSISVIAGGYIGYNIAKL